MKNITKIGLATAVVAMLMLSCKKNKAEDDGHDHHHGPSDGQGTVVLNANFNVNGTAFNYGDVYEDDFGNDYKFSLVRIYMGNIRFLDHDNNASYAEERFVLLDPDNSSYNLGLLAAGHHHTLAFNMGMDSTTNHSDPNTYPLSSPLYPQSPTMHWSWSNGYIFYKLEGMIDTNDDAVFDQNLNLHIGADELRRAVQGTLHSDIVKDQANTINLSVDLGKFMTGVDLKVENSTHTMNNMPLATKVANNSTSVITLP